MQRDLPVSNDGPDQRQCQLGVAVNDVVTADVHEFCLDHRNQTEMTEFLYK